MIALNRKLDTHSQNRFYEVSASITRHRQKNALVVPVHIEW